MIHHEEHLSFEKEYCSLSVTEIISFIMRINKAIK